MTRPDPGRLRRLQGLARLRADAETARLAATAQSRGRLRAALADLGQAEPPLAPAPDTAPRASPVSGPVAIPPPARSPDRSPERSPDPASAGLPGPDGGDLPDRHGNPAKAGPQGGPEKNPTGPAGGTAPDRNTGQASGTRSDPDAPTTQASAPVIDAALVRARLAHGAWIGTQRAHLNARLAMVEADWRRLQPVAARAFGRVQALDSLIARAEVQERQHRAARLQRDGPLPHRGPGADTSADPGFQ